jgi:ABC-type phosphate/phosphonate transport system substrate-binding protein
MARPLKVGAVMYDPKVSVIWEIIRDFFDAQGAPIDVAFYATYEDQNGGLLSGTIDVAWNSPLAWVDAQRRSGNRCGRLRCAIRIAIAAPISWRSVTVPCRRSPT